MNDLREEFDLDAWYVDRVDRGFSDRVLARMNVDALDRELEAMAIHTPPSSSSTTPRARAKRTRWVVAGAALAAAAMVLVLLQPEPAVEPELPAPAMVVMAPHASLVEGSGLDRNGIREAVREQFLPVARECYQALQQRTPEAQGTLKLEFGVVAREEVGVVDAVEVMEGSAPEDAVFQACLVAGMRKVVFDAPDARLVVIYPFVFAPAMSGVPSSVTF